MAAHTEQTEHWGVLEVVRPQLRSTHSGPSRKLHGKQKQSESYQNQGKAAKQQTTFKELSPPTNIARGN